VHQQNSTAFDIEYRFFSCGTIFSCSEVVRLQRHKPWRWIHFKCI